MIISIGGTPGSGKSTLAVLLSEKLGYKHYYMGGMRRKMAADRNLTLHQLNTLGETEDWTDREVDEYAKKLGETEDNFVIESRTAFYFIPQSLKIYITASDEVGAQRIFANLQQKDNNRNEDTGLATVQDVLASSRARVASDRIRYQKYYGIDVYDPKRYDFVLDTSAMDIPTSFQALYSFVKGKLKA